MKNPVYFGILITILPAPGVALSVQLQTVLEGDRVALPCADARSWSRRQSANVSSTISVYQPGYRHYACVGPFSVNGVCASDGSVDATGTLTLSQVTFSDAGIYECTSTLNQTRAWSVTVVRGVPPTLIYAINDISQSVDSTPFKALSVGDDMSLACVTAYAGFHDPVLQLVLSDSRGVDGVLKTSFPTTGATFAPSATSLVFVQHTVSTSDNEFVISCHVRDISLPSPSFQWFRGAGTATTSSSSRMSIPHSVGIVLVAVLVVAGALVIACVVQRRRGQQQHNGATGNPAVPLAGARRASNPSELRRSSSAIQSDEAPPPYPGALPRRQPDHRPRSSSKQDDSHPSGDPPFHVGNPFLMSERVTVVDPPYSGYSMVQQRQDPLQR